ncbi:MAG: Membrane protein [Glaciihabitans sp.]|nr:Membrane protein [Glaciihabitans sp.]
MARQHRRMTTTTATTLDTSARAMLSKVPEVTVAFWVVKVLATTVGETFADFLATTLGLGLPLTSLIMAALLAIALVFQFRSARYIPGLYWLAVVLISVVGTVASDNLVDNLNVSLWVSSAIFSVLLAATFTAWFVSEKTLSIHSIFTTRREAFYWLTILFTFALGTSAGDLLAEQLNIGYLPSALLFLLMIGIVALARYVFKLGAVISFWIAYVLTRPLGASTGDYLSQPVKDGGLGLGTTMTSVIFLSVILVVVISLSLAERRRRGQIAPLPA